MRRMMRASVVVAASMMLWLPVSAADLEPGKITVSGSGEISVRPDLAIVQFGVQKVADTARAALDANNASMSTVITLLKEAGIEDKDIQTSGFSIYPQFDYQAKPPRNNEIIGYQVRNSVTVKVTDLSMLGALLDKAVDAGLNEGGQISFTNQDIKSLRRQAEAVAVKDAMEKAELLAEAAGVKAGRIISINEGGVSSPQPPVPMRAAFEAKASAVPVEGGENSYSAFVTVTVAIEE